MLDTAVQPAAQLERDPLRHYRRHAAPLILLAQTRQADRDKAHEEATAAHHEELASEQKEAIRENTELTKLIQLQTAQIRVLATLARQMAAQVGLPPAQIEALMAVPERAEGTAPIQEAGT